MKRLITSLLLLATMICCWGQTADAVRMKGEADAMGRAKYLKTTDFSKVDSISMSDLGVFFYLDSDYVSAAFCWELTLGKLTKFGANYVKKLEALGYIYDMIGDQEALARIMVLVNENNEHEASLPCEECKCKIERAQWYAVKGDEAKAKQCMFEAETLCADDSSKVVYYEAYAQLKYDFKDFAAAARYYVAAAERRKALYGESAEMANDYYFGAGSYFIAGEREVSLQTLLPAVNYYERDTTAQGVKMYFRCLDAMQRYVKIVQGVDSALVWCDMYVERRRKIGGAHEELADVLKNRGEMKVRLKRYDDAVVDFREAIAIYDSLDLEAKITNAYSELSICYMKAGDKEMQEAVEAEKKAHQRVFYQRLLAEELNSLKVTDNLSDVVYAGSLNIVGTCYMELDSCEKAMPYYEEYVQRVRKVLREQFLLLGADGRMRVWNNFTFSIDQIKESLFDAVLSGKVGCKDRLAAVVYDLELMQKGIMLNSAIEFESVLKKSKNKALMSLYEKVKENAAKIAQAGDEELSIEEQNRLRAENEKLELQLMKGCAEYEDYTKYLAYTWQDVQGKLKEGDLAIEFLNVDLSPLARERYVLALTMSRDSMPSATVVTTKKVLDMIKEKEDAYDDEKLYNVFWGRLSSKLSGKRRVMFAPNAMLSDLAIEYFRCGDKPMSEVYEVHRLSSTKELCREYGKNGKRRAALFGNIRYSKSQKKGEGSDKRGAIGFGALQYSETELQGVATALMGGGVKVSLYEWTKATEAQFRTIDDAGYDIIHISTHGAYLGDEKTTAAEAMQVSLLAFADVNDMNEASSMETDGVVYAADVAGMNLRGCDLAVLSACETAMGAQGEDGVFGLQRGFKNAGVHSLMMSIKPVYDAATARLMVLFYENMAKGMGKREALVAAQRTLRNEGYSEGKYWAMFIIVDD